MSNFKDKYKNMERFYIPNIDDMHIGYEVYLYNIRDGWYPKILDHIDLEVMINYAYGHLTDDEYDEIYRIKYLDKSDIESLGFNEIIKDQYYIDWIGKDITFLIDDDMWCQLINEEDGIEDYLFQGTIKNKSELKRLLKQIGIC